MRRLNSLTNSAAGDLLGQIARPPAEVDAAAYRNAMTELGRQFVRINAHRISRLKRVLLVCTNEDADYLGRGVLDGLAEMVEIETHLACFWNEREVLVGPGSNRRIDLAPIVRRYVEPGDADALIVVKSIISSACVVRTNIAELAYRLNPASILVFAPVIRKGAEDKLRNEFERSISDRFEFYWFAEDDEMDGENVVPGIGGQIYERLGIGTRADKNGYIPMLVKERRTVPVQSR